MFWCLFSGTLWLFLGNSLCRNAGANARLEHRDAFRVTALVSVKTSGGSGGVGEGSYCSRVSGGAEEASDVRM